MTPAKDEDAVVHLTQKRHIAGTEVATCVLPLSKHLQGPGLLHKRHFPGAASSELSLQVEVYRSRSGRGFMRNTPWQDLHSVLIVSIVDLSNLVYCRSGVRCRSDVMPRVPACDQRI